MGNVGVTIFIVGCGSSSGSFLFSTHGDRSKGDASVDAGNGLDAGSTGGGGEPGAAGRSGSGGTSSGGVTSLGSGGVAETGGTTDRGSGAADAGAAGQTSQPDASSHVPPSRMDAGAPDADAAPAPKSTPHSVMCGAAPCDVSSTHLPVQACCVGPIQQTALCVPLTPQGCGRVGSLLTCDDVTDCQTGQVCCLDVTNNGFAGFCSTACLTTVQLCREDAECGSGHSCRPLDLRPEYGSCR